MVWLKTVLGDIAKMDSVEAVVNAANNTLLDQEGIDETICRAAGPELLAACRMLNGCEIGEAKITGAYHLPCQYVIHTVGPVWNEGKDREERLLVSCYYNSLLVAVEKGIRTIAFPSISTGAKHFPAQLAARIAVATVKRFIEDNPGTLDWVVWVLPDKKTEMLYEAEIDKLYQQLEADEI